MQYIISAERPHAHYIDIEFIIDNINTEKLIVQLPAWRPGRYELGNFAKNVQKWAVFDSKGKELKFQKISKDKWEVETKGNKKISIKYNYYAAEINAGSSYLDEKQLYINPVNCCLFVPGRENEECTVELKIPKDYKIACSLKEKSKHVLVSVDYHELADSPLIASNTLQHNVFVLDGVEFNLWFQGECKPDWPKLISDFFVFINEQFVMMREFPVKVYHFLFQILPYKFYHGVEHKASTVIALGPSYKVMKDEVYNELLGVSSHELFHVWNVKTIRPADMMPYDYTKENYSRLGYVYEGVTTYYGDLLLFRSGVFSEFEYFKTVFEQLQKHFDNFGRGNLSVAHSSFDTWLDGYVAGVPNRKSSIYTEGCIIAFITDMLIRKQTNNERSLDDVMRQLNTGYAKQNKGYTDEDYMKLVEKTAGSPFDEFFTNYVYGAKSLEPVLKVALDHIGCELANARSKKYHETFYGFKTDGNKITAVYPDSIADQEGIHANDEIISINDIPVKNDFAEWSKYFSGEKLRLRLISNNYIKEVSLTPGEAEYYKVWYIKKQSNPSTEQIAAFNSWSRRRF